MKLEDPVYRAVSDNGLYFIWLRVPGKRELETYRVWWESPARMLELVAQLCVANLPIFEPAGPAQNEFRLAALEKLMHKVLTGD